MKRDYLVIANGDSRLESAESSSDARIATLERLKTSGVKSAAIAVYYPHNAVQVQQMLEANQWVFSHGRWRRMR